MPLESCIICLDVSEFMRNGDYAPTRLDAQYDAACLLGGAKLNQNPESTVGVLSSGGKGVNILSSPTTDLGKLLACLHGLGASGSLSLLASVKTAQLALKHRKNRQGAQRIVCIIGSPVEEDERELKRLGAFLKKSSVRMSLRREL
jgi:26S proteasome regulatory subunit N10